ncbi:Gfo/Idh/MocA family protein [Paractinoplanes rishiriensis]|uniref:Oxidoreductase n=1 Tax=Paractinoplanes rishiriensis TaxID=1050105 RepID=A0A919K9W1_9ACTN|nr:Gfo/Idh/MocA family oxidoreductase [Actinoplanes rishiriensis]GIE99296.1 oxidoreductase [Actinoplanes rishiriensis]
MTATVALIGANGHGRWHRRRIAELTGAGRVRLVGLADLQPVDPDPPVPANVPLFTDHRELLAQTRPDVVVICTPPHTHLPIALDAIAAGCDLLLEKPPVASLAAHGTLAATLASSGRACQVGFQALGSAAWQQFRDSLAGLGPLDGVTATASWKRDDVYYARAPWAGKRTVGGRAVIDGVLVNPIAHAVMQALATARAAGSGKPRQLAVERYRVRDIEVEDTAFARVTFESGLAVLIAVTLAGEDFIPGEIGARGPGGRSLLEYPKDRIALPGDAGLRDVPGRTDLLTNLLDHRANGTPLLVPLPDTADFTAVLEALTVPDVPAPHLLGSEWVMVDGPQRVIPGINEVLRKATETLALPSEMGVPWAVNPIIQRLPVT